MSKNPLGFKPLKGTVLSNVSGDFGNLTAKNVSFSPAVISSLLFGALIDSAIIINSEIDNSIIGASSPNEAFFSNLTTTNNVNFLSVDNFHSVNWNPNTNIFKITGDLEVTQCGLFGNIQICHNTIKAINTNGPVNILANGVGGLNLTGNITNIASSGNHLVRVLNGSATYDINDFIDLKSKTNFIKLTSFLNQDLTTVNGSINLTTETGTGTKNITLVDYFAGDIRIQTALPHNLKVGDTITISGTSSDPDINGIRVVTNVLSTTQFNIANPALYFNTNSTVGNLLKTADNNINLIPSLYVTIPQDIKLTFGSTIGNLNSISGNTSGLTLNSPNDFYFTNPNSVLGNTDKNYIINIPRYTQLQFGSSGNTFITLDGDNLNFNNTSGNINLNSEVFISDANPKIGNFTSGTTDLTDRGWQFNYSDTTGNQLLGWFGYKKSTNKFTFLTNASKNNEIMTGIPGLFDIGTINVSNIDFYTGGTLNLACGTLANVKLITGCNGTLNIVSNVNISAANRIALISNNDIFIPDNIPINFGTNGSILTSNGNLLLTSNRTIISSSSLIINNGSKFILDGTTNGNNYIYSNTNGNLRIESTNNIVFNTTGGNIIFPINDSTTNFTQNSIQFGSSSSFISGNTNGIIITSVDNKFYSTNGDTLLYSTNGNIRVSPILVFNETGTTNSILTSSNGNLNIFGNNTNNLNLNKFGNIFLNATSGVFIPTNTLLNIGINNFITSDTFGNFTIKNTSSGNLNIDFVNNINFSSQNFNINGSTTFINSTNTKFTDPILTIAYNNNDLSDKGIEYNYNSNQLGWFGVKTDSGKFTFYSDAINTNEIITGTLGTFALGSLEINNNINFLSSGTLNMNCGTLANVKLITGCSGTVNIDSNLNVTASNINLNASNQISIPFNTPLVFGNNTANSLKATTDGNVIISGTKFIINADVQINGTTENVFSTVTNIQDPIISIGGVSGPVINDNKDRGIEFKWYNTNTSTSNVGFFGLQNSTNRFVFIPTGTNTNEVFTGSYGNVQFGNGFFNNLDLNCGTISNVKVLTGCGNSELNIIANNNFNISSNSLSLNNNTQVLFGTSSSIIPSNGSLTINSNEINLSSNSVNIPQSTPLNIGNSTILNNSSNNLNISNTSGNINLIPTTYGNVTLPTNSNLVFSGSNNSNRITSDGLSLQLYGYNSVGINSTTINLNGDVYITGNLITNSTSGGGGGGSSGTFSLNEYILPLGTKTIRSITSITNNTLGTLVTTNVPNYFSINDKVTIGNSNSTPLIDGGFIVIGVVNSSTFAISTSTLSTPGNSGQVTSTLTNTQNKDVGIMVERYDNNFTAGSAGYVSGFFGWKDTLQQFTFYKNATIANNVVTGGSLGDILVNKVFTNNISGFTLDGPLLGNINVISGTNFQIQGGAIDNTPIGQNTPSTGRFTNLVSTNASALSNVTLTNFLNYSTERFTLSSLVPIIHPNINVVVSFISVSGITFNGYGTMSDGLYDGQLKILVSTSVGNNCTYTLNFTPGKLITPNAPCPVSSFNPTKIIIKRRGQSVQLIWDNVAIAWILLTSGVYVS